ncbi:MAG: NAD(P)H-dependent oxidoreductase [Bacteroidales bacterium]|nr:NAD(P)H-dependent oxidoreductase [Bacteroidales bacterium]
MKTVKWILAVTAVMFAAVSCGNKTKAPKVLVLYYSQTSNTKTLAEEIATRLGADIEEIVPVQPYDGTYMETIERSGKERESGILPELQPISSDISAYDVVFLGYPIWFGTYARPIATLLDQIDLSGKKVVPFCTFGSGGLSSSVKDLKEKQPGAEILPGYGVRAARMAAVPKEIDNFLKQNGFVEGEYIKLDEFPEQHPVSEEEAAIFSEAISEYPMMSNTSATAAASRSIPGGTEYLFTAVSAPREGAPQMGPMEMKVYVTVEDGGKPEFTQVVR